MSIYSQGKRLDGASTIGSIVLYAGPNIPSGWLKCDGSLYQSRNSDGTLTPYDALYQIIGNKYGEGAQFGSFKVPDMSERFAEGSEDSTTLGEKKAAGLPDHYHKFTGTRTFTGYYNAAHTHSAKVGGGGSDSAQWMSNGYSSGAGSAGTWNTNSALGEHSHTFTASGTINMASAQNSVYGKSATVQPASICLFYIIKYK